MKKIFLFFLCAFVVANSLVASPVFRVRKTVTQPDGTQLTVIRTGADHLIYYITPEGIPVYPNEQDCYCYAEFNADGNVVASADVAYPLDMRNAGEQALALEYAESFQSYVQMAGLTRYGVGSIANASVSNKGDVRVAVILAEFQDVSFQEGNDIARFNKHLNASNYTEEGGAGSVRDYFIAQSDSAFRPTFDIVAKVRLSRDRKHYGANSRGSDVRAKAYIAEAADSAIAHGADLTKYKNKKGEVFLIVIYPGEGEQVSGNSEHLWAAYHYTMSHTVGDIKVTSGLVMDELADYTMQGNPEFDGIGTLCHEFSHALGLPDFYNTNNQYGIFGMDAWSVMDYGQYCNFGRTPVGYSSYEREFMGWLKIDTLHDFKQHVSIAPLHSDKPNRAYRIPNPADASGNEYYIVENRRSSPWYLSLYGEGMMVLHVDYSYSAWTANTVNNNSKRQRMTIIPADNALTPYSAKASDYQGDLFPGIKGVTSLTPTTTPATTANVGGVINVSLNDIKCVEDNVEFYFQCQGQLEPPKNLSAADISPTGFTLSCDTVKNATAYIFTLYDDNQLLRTDTLPDNTIEYKDLDTGTVYAVHVIAQSDTWLDSAPAYINVTPRQFIKGDVNNDGYINTADVVSVYNYISVGADTGIGFDFADVNADGSVNTADITAIYLLIENH